MIEFKEYIIERLKLDEETDISDKNLGDFHYRGDDITRDFRKIYSLIKDEFGTSNDALDYLNDMGDFTDDCDEFYYSFNDNKWYAFLRSVVNYDWIALCADGIIDVKNSNHPDIAEAIKKYNKPEIGKKVWASFR